MPVLIKCGCLIVIISGVLIRLPDNKRVLLKPKLNKDVKGWMKKHI
jgi:hypothetical protein